MQASALNIPKDSISADGLESINLTGLGRIVVVAGKNGSGKSRFLTKVTVALRNSLTKNNIDDAVLRIAQAKSNLSAWETNLSEYKKQLQTATGQNRIILNANINQANDNIRSLKTQISTDESRITENFVTINNDKPSRHIITFVPKKLALVNQNSMNQADIEQRANNIRSAPIEEMSDYALCKIEHLHDRYFRATHQNSKITNDKKNQIVSEYTHLQSCMREILGVEISEDSNGKPSLFGFPIHEAKLSNGQSILLQLAIAIHSQGANITDSIVFLDEPENHLHAAALIEIIEQIVKLCSNGQIWIATHSISLIAQLHDRATILYADNGRISPHGGSERAVLASLLGDEDRITRLRQYLNKPEEALLYKYAAQTLISSCAISTGDDDPQLAHFNMAISSLKTKRSGKIKILDYGSGNGRLIATIHEDYKYKLNAISDHIEYFAVELDDSTRKACSTTTSQVFSDSTKRVFGSVTELLSQENPGSFDHVVMCNILHEISPVLWADLFSDIGDAVKPLASSGSLVLIEDHRMPIGEHAHEFGFIVLDTASLKELFHVTGSDDPILAIQSPSGRIKTHIIPKAFLSRCNRKTVCRALQCHAAHASSEVQRIRATRSQTEAKQYAFWIHQHSNATLALNALT